MACYLRAEKKINPKYSGFLEFFLFLISDQMKIVEEVVPEVPVNHGGGNSISPPVCKNIVKKQISCSKNWCFTLNNWTSDELDEISSIVPKICDLSLVGKEVGESGTPHLQGFMTFKVKCRPLSHNLPKRMHWKKCKGTIQQNIVYCEKEGNVVIRHGIPAPIRVHPCELQWQIDILEAIKEEPNDRVINWYWSEAGGTRKTSTCKYLAIHHKALILGGKAADVRNGVSTYLQKKGHTPELIVVNVPKSFDPTYVSYEAFENIKDMCFYSGKYEGGMVVGNSPHLFVFANFAPDESKMTAAGRWNIVNIDPEVDMSIGTL